MGKYDLYLLGNLAILINEECFIPIFSLAEISILVWILEQIEYCRLLDGTNVGILYPSSISCRLLPGAGLGRWGSSTAEGGLLAIILTICAYLCGLFASMLSCLSGIWVSLFDSCQSPTPNIRLPRNYNFILLSPGESSILNFGSQGSNPMPALLSAPTLCCTGLQCGVVSNLCADNARIEGSFGDVPI